MIDGLKLTMSGEELQALLLARIQHHEQRAEWWARQETGMPQEDETGDAPALPETICRNEAERHAWRAEVMQFIRDHVETGETYRLDTADLELGELLPPKPEWLAQDEYEERTRVGFTLERMSKSIDGLVGVSCRWPQNHDSAEPVDGAPIPTESVEDSGEFRTTRLDCGDGPEIIMIERK